MNIRTSRTIRRTALAATLALALAACGDSPEALLGKAQESMAKNEPRAAEIHLKNLLQKEDSAEARYLLGTVLVRNGDLRGAEKEFQRAIDAGYDKAKVAPELAHVLLQLGSFRKVVDELAGIAPPSPDGKARLQTAVGRAHLALGDQDKARASFESALAAYSGHIPAQIALIGMQAGKGDVAGASAEVDKVLARRPDSAEALALKGDLEQSQGRTREAREFFAKAAAADPRDHVSRAKVASISLSLGELDAAQKAVDDLRKVTGSAPGTLLLQAQVHLGQKNFERARDAVLAALKTAPDYVPALLVSAQVHLALDSLQMAEQHAKRAIDLAPNATTGYRLLATTYMRMNAPDRALQLLQPVLERSTTRDSALYAIAGEAALRANEPAKATAWYQQASKLDPNDARKATGLALASLSRGDRERGITELEHASEMDAGSARADYALVMTHLRAREYDKALAAIDRLEQKLPGSALASNLRGSVSVAKSDLPGARKQFEEALRRDPKFYPATANLAQLDLRERKVDDAKKRYTALLEKDPKNVQAMIALAQIAQSGKDAARVQKAREDALAGKMPDADSAADPRGSKEAFDWLQKARNADRNSVPAALALTAWYMLNQQPKEAIPMLQEMVAANKDDVRLLDALGTAYLRSGQPTLAMDSFDKVLRMRPDSAPLQLRMGQLKLSLGDTAGAMPHLRKAAELDPKAVEPRTALAAAHMRSGNPAEARKVAVALQKDLPKSPAGFTLEGDIAMAERRFSDAAGSYRKALAVEKTLPVQLQLHRALASGGMSGEADTLLQSLVKERPEDLVVRMYAGDTEAGRQRWPNAIGHYEFVIGKQPNNALALNNMAWAKHELKDPKALEYAEKAFNAAPQAPPIMDTLGVILVDRNEVERGLKLLRQAVAASPGTPQYRLHLAEALLKTGDKAGARAELESVLGVVAQGPLAERARELQKKL